MEFLEGIALWKRWLFPGVFLVMAGSFWYKDILTLLGIPFLILAAVTWSQAVEGIGLQLSIFVIAEVAILIILLFNHKSKKKQNPKPYPERRSE